MLRASAVVLGVLVVSLSARAETRVDVQLERAEPPGHAALAFGAITKGTRLDAVDVRLRGLRATTKLVLSSSDAAGQDAALELEVPLGTQVTYFGLVMGGERRIAHLASAAEATAQYERIVSGELDPALIEWTGRTQTTETLRLRVFPLVRGKPANVELIMTLPPMASFVVDPGRHRIASLPRARRFALPIEAAVALDRVDADRSLFIAQPHARDEEIERARRAARVGRPPRGAFVMPRECLDNPLAASCR